MKKYALLALLLNAWWPSAPALADARDDVLENVARCGRVTDPHAWLNCYYGAAQPMRGQLGLPPAPASQLQAVPPRGAYAFAPALPPAAQSGVPQAAPLPPKPKRGGVMAELFGGQAVVTAMRATAYSFDAKNIFTITLADGTVWQQMGDDDAHPDWRGQASRLVVSIKQGSFDSYNLKVADDSRIYKVRRIR